MSDQTMACLKEGLEEEDSSAYSITTRELGERGEEAATRYLERCGYEVIERNWSCRFGEADIIALDGEELVFVEVKTRRSIEAGLPEEAITRSKQRRYERIAMMYLCEVDLDIEIPVRFDAIGICVTKKNRALLRHIKACFRGCL